MLEDARAIEIIAKARQGNVAAARRASRAFDRIFADFFRGRELQGARVLDLGPGHFDLAQRVQKRGGTVVSVDNDPAVLELGRYLGFSVIEADLRTIDASAMQGQYQGLFCKFAENAFWFEDAAAVTRHVRALEAALAPGGFGWVAPWNGLAGRSIEPAAARVLLAAQRAAFEACGYRAFELDEDLAAFYGVSGAVENHVLFVKGLPPPRAKAPLAFRARRRLSSLVRAASKALRG